MVDGRAGYGLVGVCSGAGSPALSRMGGVKWPLCIL